MNRRALFPALLAPVFGGFVARYLGDRRDVVDSSGYDDDGRPYRVHVSDLAARNVKAVYVGGRKVEGCFAFDRREGWALCYGKKVTLAEGGRALLTYKHCGTVTVAYADGTVLA